MFEEKARVRDEFIPVSSLEWQDFPSELHSGGIQWKLLRVSPETGSWTVLFKAPANSYFAHHIHHGQAEGFVFYGQVALHGYVSTGPGYVYEAAAAVHDKTEMLVDSEFILMLEGPLTWITNSGERVTQTWQDAQELWLKNGG